ncbi:hypothetical protein ACELLULO517_01105 [Acidisoma cellulosilytica]|uniref:DUF2225 domain-containing protein n=1 Tax=Acidisoma cellulosilyticum TaxID=2802395 RepID=A0A963YXV1_9PROT|nr:hypothetical protein [Acidisoma cellulosilyticum]MCB8878814.1 hypothetical protein [Acidisoma cellulosilyticum]
MSSLCAVCGAVVKPEFKAPMAELSPDLDFRPGEPARSTLRHWVAVCSGCGAAAPDLAKLTEADAAVVRNDPEYAALRDQAPAFARHFLLWALLSQRRDDPWPAAEALLQAAWAADDAEDAEWARLWRAQAAELWPGSRAVQPRLCLIDIARRSGDFSRAAVIAEALMEEPLDENSAAIVDFQRHLIAERDTGRQLLSSALRPPASRPHVSYNQAQNQGGSSDSVLGHVGSFWRRLFGRD